MKNPIYEKKNQRAALIDTASKALEAGDMDGYNNAMADVARYNTEIDALEKLQAEQGRFSDKDARMTAMALEQEEEKKATCLMERINAARSTREYHNAFRDAIRKGTSDNNAAVITLNNIMTETGGTPVGSDGGFLVPVDMQTQINELKRSFTNLIDYVRVENVTTLSGSRVLEVGKAATGFSVVNEGAQIGEIVTPTFKQISYAIKKYAGIAKLTKELVDDESGNLLSYLARWMARKAALTENTLIIAALNTLTATAYGVANGIADLKKALNKTLDPDISINSIILTNQSGFNFLDNLNDAEGRGLLQPDPTRATGKIALGRPVVMVSNTVLPDVSSKAPLYVGDLEEFITVFNRMGYEMDSTNVGGEAWRTATTEVRGMMRNDLQKIDTAAVVKYEVAV